MSTRTAVYGRLLLRLLFALSLVVAIAGTAYLCNYYQYRYFPHFHDQQFYTQRRLDILSEIIDQHRAEHGTWPESLSQVGEKRDRIDEWGHPIQYRIDGETYTLFSFGRDGLPGGEWLDADVYPRSAGRPLAPPTLRQFTNELPTGGIQATCVLAGVCAGLVILLPRRNQEGKASSWFLVLVRFVVTTAAAIGTALIISVVHLPSGH